MIRRAFSALFAALLLLAAPALPATAAEPLLHSFEALTMSPDGSRVADIEHDDPAVDGTPVHSSLIIRRTSGSAPIVVPLACGTAPQCIPSSPAWSADGKHLAYVLRAPDSSQRTIESVDENGRAPKQLFSFLGTLNALRYAPDGSLTVLANARAAKEAGATQAGAAIVGEIGTAVHEQRIARIRDFKLTWASPADLYVYEYDAIPHSGGFVGTAAHGDGDNNWWVAKLYAFDASGSARIVYTPAGAQQQLAHPRVSPDGKRAAFIAGIMSDFGSTGGDLFVIDLQNGTGAPLEIRSSASTFTSFAWDCAGSAVTSYELEGGIAVIRGRHADAAPASATSGAAPVWTAAESMSANDGFLTGSCSTQMTAAVHQNFTTAPEIEVGRLGSWHDLTHVNQAVHIAASAKSVSWNNDGFNVQGWLLTPYPQPAAGMKRVTLVENRPMIVQVHGGPSAASTPRFVGRGDVRNLLARGYDIFEPNPRGSFGNGENFTLANVKDFGYGDLRDIMTGIDAVEKQYPVDDNKLGIMGGSYGGYMTMWAVTQTHRFKAAVAAAGLSDWESYYGENGIDEWMIPFFGASVYDDPAVYAKSSPITFIKNVTTPTFEYVGERDVECPPPQTQEFWHALMTLGVPTSFVVYAGEGHGLRAPANRKDAEQRTIAWFAKYLK